MNGFGYVRYSRAKVMYYGEHGSVGFVGEGGGGCFGTFKVAHTVVAGEGGACSLPEGVQSTRDTADNGPRRSRRSPSATPAPR